jgi:predicted ATP-grasp superfamily ATP-dependent carboligase
MATIKILMCDGLNRSGLAVAKALKQADDFKIHFVTKARKPYEITLNILNLHLINGVDTIDTIKEGYSESSYADSLIEIVKKRRIDLILPIGNSVVYISKIKRYLERYSRVLVEDYEKLIKFHDKSQTLIMAKELDIPYPFTVIPKNVNDIKFSASKLKYPIVLKARKGAGADGVWYARSAPELINLYLKVTDTENIGDGVVRDTTQPMLQEYIPGELHDVTAFCINGKMKLGLTQKRLLTRPLSGGAGIFNVTTKNEQLLQYASEIIHNNAWTGVMLIDFKMDSRDGRPKLLEINPRFWGTTWLTIKAGFNYPYYLVSDALGRSVTLPKNYSVGLHCRWPILELKTIFEKPISAITVFRRAQSFLSRFKTKNCVYEFFRF